MSFFSETFSCLSRLLNVCLGGTADLTLSARSHRDGLRAERLIDAVFRFLFGEEDHCRTWWLHEVERARTTLEHYKTERKTT